MEWISVKDRAPEDGKIVLVTDGRIIGISSCYSEDESHRYIINFGYYIGNEAHIENVTHWMPLPEPPKE